MKIKISQLRKIIHETLRISPITRVRALWSDTQHKLDGVVSQLELLDTTLAAKDPRWAHEGAPKVAKMIANIGEMQAAIDDIRLNPKYGGGEDTPYK